MRTVIWLLILIFLFSTPVQALTQTNQVVFSDDFSSGLGKWQVARGNTTMWSINNDILQGEVTTTGTITELIPIDSAWSAAWRNYEFECDIKAIAGSDKNVAWGYLDANNWTELHFIPSVMQMARRKNQSVIWYKDQSVSLANGEWHHLKISTSGGKIMVWIDAVFILAFDDPDYDGNPGRIALKVGTGVTAPARVQFDNVQVRLLADENEINLPVPIFRQDDRNWADANYDSAPLWAGVQPTTIRRWGCALTSAVMVLRFYGFTTLLDGTPLTPLSLNTWLMNQVDGYIADGWVNWVALVRLARQLRIEWSNLSNPLPQLRYLYQNWTDWETDGKAKIISELQKGSPSILELPHHFVVASGTRNANQEVTVVDPLSDKNQVSEFTSPISARSWEVQHGSEVLDLSYWIIVFPKGLRLKLMTEDGTTITRWWLSHDQPGGDEMEPESPWQVLTVPQPPHGKIRLFVAQATGDAFLDGGEFPVNEALVLHQPYELKLFYYDSVANVKTLLLHHSLGVTEQEWWLNAETSEISAQPQRNWENFIQELNQFENDGLLSPFVATRFRQVALYARASAWLEVSPELHDKMNQRYLNWLQNLFENVLQFDASLMSETAARYFRDWLGDVTFED